MRNGPARVTARATDLRVVYLASYTEKAVSIITWLEVMVGANHDLEAGTRSFLSGFDITAVDEVIAERAVSLRRSCRIKLPDAVIWATAQGARHAARHAQHKDVPVGHPGVRAPYGRQGADRKMHRWRCSRDSQVFPLRCRRV